MFLNHQRGALVRTWSVFVDLSDAACVTLTLDASPWGLGGVLSLDGIMKKYFYSRLTVTDARLHKRQLGSSKGQQTWESLSVLVALRIWQEHWQGKRVRVEVRSDNYTALTGAAKLKGKQSIGLILRDLAYLYATNSFEPAVCLRVPGVANTLADKLSRIFEPGSSGQVSSELKHLECTSVPTAGGLLRQDEEEGQEQTVKSGCITLGSGTSSSPYQRCVT